jgi:predicted RNA-binding protein with RPS1 domain
MIGASFPVPGLKNQSMGLRRFGRPNLGGIDGLVHLSEVSDQWIADLSKSLKKGQEVKCTVIGIDEEKHHISLSMRSIENGQIKS